MDPNDKTLLEDVRNHTLGQLDNMGVSLANAGRILSQKSGVIISARAGVQQLASAAKQAKTVDTLTQIQGRMQQLVEETHRMLDAVSRHAEAQAAKASGGKKSKTARLAELYIPKPPEQGEA